jgi:hypothetical protein
MAHIDAQFAVAVMTINGRVTSRQGTMEDKEQEKCSRRRKERSGSERQRMIREVKNDQRGKE